MGGLHTAPLTSALAAVRCPTLVDRRREGFPRRRRLGDHQPHASRARELEIVPERGHALFHEDPAASTHAARVPALGRLISRRGRARRRLGGARSACGRSRRRRCRDEAAGRGVGVHDRGRELRRLARDVPGRPARRALDEDLDACGRSSAGSARRRSSPGARSRARAAGSSRRRGRSRPRSRRASGCAASTCRGTPDRSGAPRAAAGSPRSRRPTRPESRR